MRNSRMEKRRIQQTEAKQHTDSKNVRAKHREKMRNPLWPLREQTRHALDCIFLLFTSQTSPHAVTCEQAPAASWLQHRCRLSGGAGWRVTHVTLRWLNLNGNWMNCLEAIQPSRAINPYYWQDFEEQFDFEMKWRQTLVVFDTIANKNSLKVRWGVGG